MSQAPRRIRWVFAAIFVGWWLMVFGFMSLQERNYRGKSEALITMSSASISDFKVYDHASSHDLVLLSASAPSDEGTIQDFVHAINHAVVDRTSPRQFAPWYELYIVIGQNDGGGPIELLLNRDVDCGKTIYIRIVRTGEFLDSIAFLGGAKENGFLYEWLIQTGLLVHLGCD